MGANGGASCEDAVKERIGARMYTLRQQRGMSLKELAALCGVHENTIDHIEAAEHNCLAVNLWKIAGALGVEIGYFFK